MAVEPGRVHVRGAAPIEKERSEAACIEVPSLLYPAMLLGVDYSLNKGNSNRMARGVVESSRFAEPPTPISVGLRVLALFLRVLFVGALVAITVRVSTPQSETLWSVHETPGDLVRFALGIAVCLWIAMHVFTLPKTVEAYKRWVYLGLVIAPVSLVAAVMIWR